MKKIMSVFLAMVILLSFLSVSAFAEENNVVNEIHIHFPEGISGIPIPKAGEAPIEYFEFVYDEKDVGLDRYMILDHMVCEANGSVVVGNYKYGTYYWEYFYIYVDDTSGYKFPEDPYDIVFTDEKVAEELAGFERSYPSYDSNVLMLERGTRTEKLKLNAEDIMITQKGSAPEIGQVIPPYTDEFEYQGLELEGYMEKIDRNGEAYECNPGETYEEGYLYMQWFVFTLPYGYEFGDDVTADTFPDFEGYEKYFTYDGVQYYREIDFSRITIYGDVDGSESVNAVDANLVRRYAAKLVELDEHQLKAADVNGDGSVNAIDANLIRRYAAKLIDKFPVEE